MLIENVKDLSKDTFLERDIYDEIMVIEDELTRQMTSNKVRDRAKEVGAVTIFDKSMAAAVREFKKREKAEIANSNRYAGESITSFTMEGDVVVELKCGEWVAGDDGVWIHTDKGMIRVCPHPIYISRILKNAETGKYKAELTYKINDRIHKIYVPKEVIVSSSKILQLANDGIQIIDRYAPMLVQYLADLESLNPIEHRISTSRLGWVDGIDASGKSCKQFLPYQANVIFDNELNIKSLFDSIKCSGSRETWYKLMREIRAKRQPEVLLNIAASFASVLVEPCGTLPFIVSLWGGTGIGKSVILKICTSIWADPSEGKYITDAKATSTAMEMRLNVLNSLPMTLDDMAQVKNQYDDDFSELIYRWCAGKGRDRSNKELGLNKLTSWRNCTITNGERSLVDESTQGGAINRVIDIESSGEILFTAKEGGRTSKIIEKNYGFAGEEFVREVYYMGFDAVTGVYNDFYEKLKAAALEIGVEKEEKQLVPMALMLTADHLAEKWLFQDGVTIDLKTALSYLRNKGDVSEEGRAYEYLMDIIAANHSRFEYDIESSAEQWGFWVKDDVQLAINGTIFERIMKQGGFQGKAFLSWAKRNNLIECGEGGRTKKVVRAYGKTLRAVVIDTTWSRDRDAELEAITAELPFK